MPWCYDNIDTNELWVTTNYKYNTELQVWNKCLTQKRSVVFHTKSLSANYYSHCQHQG